MKSQEDLEKENEELRKALITCLTFVGQVVVANPNSYIKEVRSQSLDGWNLLENRKQS